MSSSALLIEMVAKIIIIIITWIQVKASRWLWETSRGGGRTRKGGRGRETQMRQGKSAQSDWRNLFEIYRVS